MLTLIEKLRTKSKAVRVQYAFLMALLITAIVALLWSLTLPTRLANISTSLSGDATPAAAVEANRSVWQKLQAATAAWWSAEPATSSSSTTTVRSADLVEKGTTTTPTVQNNAQPRPAKVVPIRIATSSQRQASSTVSE